MSKTPKKSAKPTVKKAAAKKPKAKMKASVKPMADAKGSRRGFMWKALERKQQLQKDNSAMPQANPSDRLRPNATAQGFARFNGPRRRVG